MDLQRIMKTEIMIESDSGAIIRRTQRNPDGRIRQKRVNLELQRVVVGDVDGRRVEVDNLEVGRTRFSG
jgi:hypothetical protein